ncbi:MAG: helix-turn-helix domain-containing protein [Gemmatimonadota bacterium]
MRSTLPRLSALAQQPVPFDTRKYGPELLVDIAWVHQMKRFILTGPHALAFYDITLVTRGRGSCSLDGVRSMVRPGTVLFTSPGQVRIWQVKDLDGICLFFPGLFLDEFFNDTLFLQRLGYFHAPGGAPALALPPARAAALRAALEKMRRELGRLRPDTPHLLRAQAYELLITLARQYAEAYPAGSGRIAERRTQRFLELIERDQSGKRSVAHYAREVTVSPGYLNTLCRHHLGRNAKDLIAERVVLEARRMLLYSDRSVDQVGRALGFKDPSYFSRFFRMRAGMVPSRFRDRHR